MKSWKQRVWQRKPEKLAKDYSHYEYTPKEQAMAFLEGMLCVGLIGYCFYDSIVACLLLSPGIFVYVECKKKRLMKAQQHALRTQFKDAILAVSANQKAGYSIENAFQEAYVDMKLLYGEHSLICHELLYVKRGLQNNLTLEKLLYSLGERSQIRDIQEFGEVFAIAKRNGGNLSQVIASTVETIEEKLDVEQEIHVMTTAKHMEANIMSVVPFLIIVYMNITSAGFFDVLYHNVMGIIVMSVCLFIYLCAYFCVQKIMEIKV